MAEGAWQEVIPSHFMSLPGAAVRDWLLWGRTGLLVEKNMAALSAMVHCFGGPW